MSLKYNAIFVQNVQPTVDAGRFPIKRRVGDSVTVRCEAYRDGHGFIDVLLLFRKEGKRKWQEVPMTCLNLGLDLYEATFDVEEMGFYEYQIEGYTDYYRNWAHGARKKMEVGEELSSDILEGIAILEDCAKRAKGQDKKVLKHYLESLQEKSTIERISFLLSENILLLAATYPDRKSFDTGKSEKVYKVRVDRKQAEYASWYEMFPRSAGDSSEKSGTFKDVENFLPYIQDMGFDVLYFTPIHPIGKTKRKGKNNSLTAADHEPGSPYAIGDASGGHFAVHPELGTLEDFDQLVAACAERGIEIALDYALNCSPDHPYLKSHPDWFYTRPDGSIKCAENPPKKYEDVYPLNFECDDRKALWTEIKDSLVHWADHGVKIFRIDNPHTKPIEFWQWCIEVVQKKHPDVIFLSEAFTRPRLLESLAKIGFTQSYGYFTWRETKEELTEYYEYLTKGEVKEYLINNTFPTTPDILPKHLQNASPEIFKIRLTLATTLSSVYGMYSGYELCENIPVGPRDELMNSEKYEFVTRNFNDPISIAPYVTSLNKIRKENPALQKNDSLRFHEINNDKILCYSKYVEGNLLLIYVNLDPENTQSGVSQIPMAELGIEDNALYHVHDLLTDRVYDWSGDHNYVEMNPQNQVAHVFRVF